jgi:NAD(P)H-flavin reductase
VSAAEIADPMIPQLYRAARVRRELNDVATLDLLPVEGPSPAFRPGQFNMLYAFGIGEVAISLSGSPTDAKFVHTVRDVGSVSRAITSLAPGAMLGVRGPFGTAWPTDTAKGADVVFVAGGLGLAPLRPAVYEVFANRAQYGRVVLLYGTRSPRDILYRREIERWRRRLDVEISVTVDHADPDWRGNVGVVPKLVRQATFDPANATAMVCGPEVMMRFTASALLEMGIPHASIHLSMERNMKCAIGLCGHCQFGPSFICKDGPVMSFDRLSGLLGIREL